ncbi:Gfo/Idh/MocA family oxidoreductase [Metabacillus iocasae]|uniref:Dehydrogenase n=1 Tax=Priestia iocasae TaxID=2291674 RepID=A0ABS2QU70_9BACI|nr:Gfo/Idh/MocA family oxidoreductase [Metabacillus iocasae]MBM7703016.1 putative dehydrogenase [Metabacillus iocasae]
MVKRLGVIGLSPENGHPFSFSAIINGYDDEHMKHAGWNVIYDYLRKRDKSEFGIPNTSVTHCWTQDKTVTESLAKACKIKHPVEDIHDLVSEIDGVLIARDDYASHYLLAKPFLEKGIPVFIDKPLTLNLNELSYFLPFLNSGQLMSTSSFRFSHEVKEAKKQLFKDETHLLRGTIVNGWEKYGVHLIEGFAALTDFQPQFVEYEPSFMEAYVIYLKNGSKIQVNCAGSQTPVFIMEALNKKQYIRFEVKDNFSMFKQMLHSFIESIDKQRPVVNPDDTTAIMKTLMAGLIAKSEGRRVSIDEIILP